MLVGSFFSPVTRSLSQPSLGLLLLSIVNNDFFRSLVLPSELIELFVCTVEMRAELAGLLNRLGLASSE